MNNSTVNLTTPETSTHYKIQSWELIVNLEIFVYSINLFSFPTHCYVIWLIVGSRSGVALEFFNLNLSVCEIGICLNSLFFILSRWFSCLEFLDQFLAGFTFTGRPLFQCLMCVERYLAVVHPVTFLKYKPLRYRVFCCTAAWIINIGSCLVCMYNVASKNHHAHALFLTVELTLVISIQLFCLVAVFRALKHSGPGEGGRKREVDNPIKRRALFLILITTVTMFILFFPFVIIGLFIIVTADSSPAVWLTGVTCFILAGFVQPLLYLHRTGKLSFVPH
ncbi:C-C chemokine receptor type 8-like [Carassius auratus]|uniref:C-C chemokine receptor type 8-like n=1 Tax=Carassius auratus TaxID=7957 RepID=A0A6P6IXD2_CARAU|nr:C-C chemokine receptor type 8-like [Carassius auratus]XP_026052454.1 C-C chemokine receptor type 8-like [Carassius auratus]